MIKILYCDDVDLENFEYGCENYDLHDIQEWHSDYITKEDFEDLIYTLAGIIRFDIKDNDIEIHIVNKLCDGNMELFGEGVEKYIEIKVANPLIRLNDNGIAYVNRDGKVFNNPGDPDVVRHTDMTYLSKAQIEYDLFMVRAYGEDYKADRLSRINKDLYTKKDVQRLYNETQKTHGTNV